MNTSGLLVTSAMHTPWQAWEQSHGVKRGRKTGISREWGEYNWVVDHQRHTRTLTGMGTKAQEEKRWQISTKESSVADH